MRQLDSPVKIWIAVVLVLGAASCRKGSAREVAAPDPAAAAHLQALLDAGEYFALRAGLEASGSTLSPAQQAYFRAFVQGAFNHYPESIAGIRSLLATTDPFLSDAARVDLLVLLRNDYFRSFQYASAAASGRDLLNRYRGALGDRLHDVENSLLIHDALSGTPPQTVDLVPTSTTWKRNRIGLIEIPIRSGGAERHIVVDTRAHISTVTQSFAKKLGVRMLDVSYEESSGITGRTFRSGLGVADSVRIGDVVVHNVVFQVLPDEQLYFSSIRFGLDGLLGFPVLTQLKEVRITRNGRFTIRPSGQCDAVRNLAFDNATTVVAVEQGADALSFHFDTGATGTDLYSAYFNRYRKRILEESTPRTVESASAGGSIDVEVYALPSLTLIIGGTPVHLRDLGVRTTPAFKGQRYYGNLGQDVMQQFDETILNFDSMCL